jgi:hypothetical protein
MYYVIDVYVKQCIIDVYVKQCIIDVYVKQCIIDVYDSPTLGLLQMKQYAIQFVLIYRNTILDAG